MVLQHVLFRTIAKVILPLAVFENNLINPSAIAVGVKPPCLAAQLASWYDRVNPSVDATAVEWPSQYSQDCLDCPSVALSEDVDDAMITAMIFPTEMPASFSITVDNTNAPVHSRVSAQLLPSHQTVSPASATATSQAGDVPGPTAAPAQRNTPTQPPPSIPFPSSCIWQCDASQRMFNASNGCRRLRRFSSSNTTTLQYAAQFMLAVFGLLAFLVSLSFGSKVIKKTVSEDSIRLTAGNEEGLQLASPLNIHLLPGRLIICLHRSISRLEHLVRYRVTALATANRRNEDLARQLAHEKDKNVVLEKDLLTVLLELAKKTDHLSILQHWGRLLCHNNSTLVNKVICLDTKDLAMRGIILTKETQHKLLTFCKTYLETENVSLTAANTSLRDNSVQTRGLLSIQSNQTKLLSFRNTYLNSERARLNAEITRLRIHNVQTRGLLTTSATQTQLLSYHNAQLNTENAELKRDLGRAVVEYIELEHKHESTTQNLKDANTSISALSTQNGALENTVGHLQAENSDLMANRQPNLVQQVLPKHSEDVSHLRSLNDLLLDRLKRLRELESLVGVKSSTKLFNLSGSDPSSANLSGTASTVYIYEDPAREDLFLRKHEFKEYAKLSRKKRTNLRTMLTEGSAKSLQISEHDYGRLPTLQRRRRHSICYGEPSIVTDTLPINSGRNNTKWHDQQKFLGSTRFSATKRVEAIEQQSKSRPNRKTTENFMESASNGMVAEIRRAPSEYRHNFFEDLFKTRSASMTHGLVLTDILDINRTLAMYQELYSHTIVLGGWTAKEDFDMSRPLWSKPEVRCSRFSQRMMGKTREIIQNENPVPPRVKMDNARTGNHGRGMMTQAAHDTTLRIMLDPNTVNTDNVIPKERREFFFEHSEKPTKRAEWNR